MMRFIVLGLIPGTQTEITFGWIVGIIISLLIVALVVADIRWMVYIVGHRQSLVNNLRTIILSSEKKAVNFVHRVLGLVKDDFARW